MAFISKDFIGFEALNPDYPVDQAKAIVNEFENKGAFDTGYIREKLRNIENFVQSLEQAWDSPRFDLYFKENKKNREK